VTAAPPAPLFDPFAPGFTDDPYPQYAVMRDAAPVYEHPFGFWLLTRYDDVSWLLRAGLSVEDRNLADGPFTQLRDQMLGDQNRDNQMRVNGLSMLDRDPPDHTRLRRLVSKAFTPRAIQALEPRVAALVDAPPNSSSHGRTRGSTSPSAPARITASARPWPGSRPPSPFSASPAASLAWHSTAT
jgi:cytochrome P450